MLGGIKPAAVGLPGETLRITMAVRIHGRAGERIISRDAPIGVEAQNFAIERFGILSIGRRLGVAHRPVELAVRAKLDAPAIVVAGSGDAL